MVRTGEWLSEAWEIVQKDMIQWALVFLVGGLVSCIPFVAAGIAPGYVLIVRRRLRDPSYVPEIGDIFEGFEYFVPTLLFMIVGGLIGAAGAIACLVGVFATAALVMFGLPLIVDRGMDFWPAIQKSMEKVKEDLVSWSIFVLVLDLVYLVGVIVCVVGVLVSGPVGMVAFMLAYQDLFGFEGEAAPEGATGETTPPESTPSPAPQAPEAPSAEEPSAPTPTDEERAEEESEPSDEASDWMRPADEDEGSPAP